MKVLLRTALLVLAAWLQLSGISYAKQVYLKDGSTLECESFWRRNGWVVVKVNRDILLEFTNAEIDLKKTFRNPARPEQRIQKKKQSAPASVSPTAKAAESPELAVVKSKQPSQEVPPAPAQAAAPSAKAEPAVASSKPVPAPTPVAAPVATPASEAAASAPAQPEPSPAAMTKEDFEKRSRENADMMAQAIKDNNPEQMKKALAAQQELVKQKAAADASGNAPQKGEPGWFKYFLMLMASCLFIIIAMWVVFKKAGESGWKSLIPIYNMYVLMQISGKPGWWSFVMLVPVVGVAVYLLAMLSLAEKFGRSAAYGVGLFLLPMFFFPMLAFGGAKYEEAMPHELEFTFSENPVFDTKPEEGSPQPGH